jgi:hypothetical protein
VIFAAFALLAVTGLAKLKPKFPEGR